MQASSLGRPVLVACAVAGLTSACSLRFIGGLEGESTSSAMSASASAGSGGAGGEAGAGGASSSDGASSSAMTGSGGGVVGPRPFPDTTKRTGLLVDRLPAAMSPAQLSFVASHFDGARRITAPVAQAIRAHRSDFLVLHERLAIWQPTADLEFILDGKTWGSDFDVVDVYEPWFWHDAKGKRVASGYDGKWLMNVANTDFRGYWSDSVAKQIAAGDFDGVLATVGSPTAILEEGLKPREPRLEGTGLVTAKLPELGGFTFSEEWEGFAVGVEKELAAKGYPLLVDVGDLAEPWDTTKYGSVGGVMVDVTRSAGFSVGQWIPWANRLLALTGDRTVIVKGRLDKPTNRELRRYFHGIYLLVRGPRTFLDYHAANALEWYPEWSIDLGAPLETGKSIDELVDAGGLFVRRFEKGWVYVNPTDNAVPATFESVVNRVVATGGGTVFAKGVEPGELTEVVVDFFKVEPHSAEIFKLMP